MNRDLQIIGDRKLRDEVAEDLFNEHKRRNGYEPNNKMISDYDTNRDYWQTLADIAIERISRCLT